MTTREQRVNRRLTKLFIKIDPREIRLTPYQRLDDDLGGWRYVAGDTRPTQRFKFIESGQPGTNAARNATGSDGILREIEFEIVGFWDADITLYDRFTMEGDEFEVVQIWPDNGWEKRASVVRHAET